MSIKKYASVQEIFDEVINHYNLKGYNALAQFLGVPYQTLMAWKKRGRIGDYTPFLDKCIGIRLEWLKTGEGEMLVAEPGEQYHVTKIVEEVTPREKALIDMVHGDEDLLGDVIKYAQEKKLLKELLREKTERKAG